MQFASYMERNVLKATWNFRWCISMKILYIYAQQQVVSIWGFYKLGKTPLRPPRGIHEAHLCDACQPCFITAIPSQTYGNK